MKIQYFHYLLRFLIYFSLFFKHFFIWKIITHINKQKNVPIAMQLDFTSVYIIHFDFILVLLQFIFWENDVYISIFQIKVFRLGSSERVLSSHPLSRRSTMLLEPLSMTSTYINTKLSVYLFVCWCFSRPFRNRLGYPLAQSCFLPPGGF